MRTVFLYRKAAAFYRSGCFYSFEWLMLMVLTSPISG